MTAMPIKPSMFAIEMLPAEVGDCLWIEYGDPKEPRRILIDCGANIAADTVRSRLGRIVGSKCPAFELFVLTHIDADHIGGVLRLFEDDSFDRQFGNIWFNGWRQVRGFLSVQQAEEYTDLLEDRRRNLPWNNAREERVPDPPPAIVLPDDDPLPSFRLPGEMTLTLLSPGGRQLQRMGRQWLKVLQELRPERALLGRKAPPPQVEDYDAFDLQALASKNAEADPSPANGSSIAVLAEFEGRSALLTGDAYANVLADSIARLQKQRGTAGQKLAVDAFKLSHHGSANATSRGLLEMVECRRYLVSTNGSQFYHPDREAIARVILYGGHDPRFVSTTAANSTSYGAMRPCGSIEYHMQFPEEEQAGLRIHLEPEP